MDRDDRWILWVLAGLATVIAVAVYFGVRGDNKFRAECEGRGGRVESHQEGWTTTLVSSDGGKTWIPQVQPNMVTTCEGAR